MVERSYTVLGINDGHDSGAAIVRDGRVLAAVQEERLNNTKHYSGVPALSLREVFRISGLHPSTVDAIALVSLNRVYAPLDEYPLRVKVFEKISPYLHGHTFSNLYVRILGRFRDMRELMKVLADLELSQVETHIVEHHITHASNAYRSSPWDYDLPILIFTADGAGDGLSSTVSIGEGGRIRRVASSTFYHSLGNAFYSEITRYLGMKPWDHEYKVMGLAPYGDPTSCLDTMKKLIRLNPRNPLEFENTSGAYLGSIQGRIHRLLAGQRFDNIAASAQKWFEILLTDWIVNATRKYGIYRVTCSGGLFLNVKANKLIVEREEIEEAFFYPAAGDDGTPVGAALEVYSELCFRDGRKPVKVPMEHLYYGSSYDEEEVLKVLKRTGWKEKSRRSGDVHGEVGEMISNGKIVARFSGGVEWGPRALGNRSIVADPRDLRTVHRINAMVKHRDFWMPFAPSILEEDMAEYMINPRPARYMIMAFDTTEKRDDIVAAIHLNDRTCRPQTIEHEWNPGYRRTVEEFRERTGVSSVLNTSFNLHGYPMVGTPELAIWTFENSALDALALGDWIVERR